MLEHRYELPLFTAIKRKLNANILDVLIRAYPEAANTKVERKLPLTIAAKIPKHANQLETCKLLWKFTDVRIFLIPLHILMYSLNTSHTLLCTTLEPQDLELDLYHQNRTMICLSSANDQLHNWARSLGAKYGKYAVHTPVRPLYISRTAEVYSCNVLDVENESLDKEEDSSEEEDSKEDGMKIRDTRLKKILKKVETMHRVMGNIDFSKKKIHLKFYMRQALEPLYSSRKKRKEVERNILELIARKNRVKKNISSNTLSNPKQKYQRKRVKKVKHVAIKIFRNEMDYLNEIKVRSRIRPLKKKQNPDTEEFERYVIGVIDHGIHRVDECDKNVSLDVKPSDTSVLTSVESIAFDVESIRAKCPSWEGAENEYWLAMELADRSLFQAMSSERIAGYDVVKVQKILRDVSKALKFLHETCGIIHADLKPRNTVRSVMGDWKLIDFDKSLFIDDVFDPEHTKCVACGYWAPELVSRMCSKTKKQAFKTFSVQSSLDMWSFGVMAYELCSGQRLFSLDLNNDEIQDPLDIFRLCVWSHVRGILFVFYAPTSYENPS